MKTSLKNTSKHGGLTLKRREGESITIEGKGKITFTILSAGFGTAAIVFDDAGQEFKILRTELLGDKPAAIPSPL